MGAWGAAIFSDDTACDVRDEYRDLVSHGAAGPAATDQLLVTWADAIEDSDDGPVFWIALALTQWKLGRLEERVKERALVALSRDADAERWAEATPRHRRARAKALAAARATLVSPSPPAKRLRVPTPHECPWEIGDWISYRLTSGRYVVLSVVDVQTTTRGPLPGRFPVVEVRRWERTGEPRFDEARALAAASSPWPADAVATPIRIALTAHPKQTFPVERLRVIGQVPTAPTSDPARYYVLWSAFDEGSPLLRRTDAERRDHLAAALEGSRPPLIRTDFTDEPGWAALRGALDATRITIVDDGDYAGLAVHRLIAVLPPGLAHKAFFIADRRACTEPVHPVMVVDLDRDLGRVFRAAASAVGFVALRGSAGSDELDRIAGAVDADGVFRGPTTGTSDE